MPINVYTGLMRSGKSYEVVAEVILPAVAQGRRVVTNVDGISDSLVREYVHEKKGVPLDRLGSVVHVDNAAVSGDKFFPHYDDQKGIHVDTVVQPGDLVVIDEAWRFWPSSGGKILKTHQSFFLEHGHFTHPDTGVSCDLVLMIQDMGTLHRSLKAVVAFSSRTHKKVSLGLSKVYSVTMFEGHKQAKAQEIGNWVRKYNPEIFPLYSSFSGGADGKMVNVDSRQNIFKQKKIWITMIGLLAFSIWSMRTVWHFFHPAGSASAVKTAASGPNTTTGTPAPAPATKPTRVGYSDEWRLSGTYMARGQAWVVLVNAAGALRFESPSMFQGAGLVQSGEIDGARVSSFSGPVVNRSAAGVVESESARGAK